MAGWAGWRLALDHKSGSKTAATAASEEGPYKIAGEEERSDERPRGIHRQKRDGKHYLTSQTSFGMTGLEL